MKSIGLSEHLAVEVRDLDLSLPLSVEEVAELRTLWNRHLVLRFRAQTLTDDQLMTFSRNFGELDYAPMGRISAEERARLPNPYVAIVSNIVEDGRHIGDLGALEAHWHTDLSYVEEPVSGSVLYAVEVPPSGGDTSFTSMHTAYNALPAHLRERVSTLSLKHTASHDSAGELRRGHEEATDPRDAPGPVHPLTVVHPETGRRALLLERRQLAYIPALSVEDSEALLDELWSYVGSPEYTWTQQWRVGDVLMWDNRAVMHHRDSFDSNSRRLMRRTQLKGKKPIAASASAETVLHRVS